MVNFLQLPVISLNHFHWLLLKFPFGIMDLKSPSPMEGRLTQQFQVCNRPSDSGLEHPGSFLLALQERRESRATGTSQPPSGEPHASSASAKSKVVMKTKYAILIVEERGVEMIRTDFFIGGTFYFLALGLFPYKAHSIGFPLWPLKILRSDSENSFKRNCLDKATVVHPGRYKWRFLGLRHFLWPSRTWWVSPALWQPRAYIPVGRETLSSASRQCTAVTLVKPLF